MKKSGIICILVAVILAFTFVFAACRENLDDITPADSSEILDAVQTVKDKSEFSAESDWDDSLQPQAEGDVTISESGTYLFRGNYGKLTVGASDLKLHFVFDNAHFACDDGIAVDGSEYKKNDIVITLAADSENTVANGIDNAIQIKGVLTVNGSGKLTVQSDGKNALKVSKELYVADARLDLSAANHAISALSVIAKNCTLNVLNAGKDGINAECDDETTAFTAEEGFVSFSNVMYTCNCDGDGIQADTVVSIEGGNCKITTNGEFVENSSANREKYGLEANDFRYVKNGNEYQKVASDYFGNATYALKQGCKGIKAGEIEYPDPENPDGAEITVTQGEYCIVLNGDFDINSTDDAIHANSGSVVVNGGTLRLQTLDDGLTADKLVRVVDGEVTVTNSHEGLEGAFVEILGGSVQVNSSDDGINAASDDSSVDEYILISGGTVTVNAQGDGIDSNGSIDISGGTTVVYGPTGNGDGGLDSETGVFVNGGTLLVLASRGMTEPPVSGSRQKVFAYGLTNAVQPCDIYVCEVGGATLFETSAPKAFQTVIFSCDKLESGKSYAVYSGETKLAEIKLTSQVTTSGIQGGFGGSPDGWQPGMGPGGGRPSRP